MNIICAICTELILPSDDLHFSPCGHLFHFTCISEWLKRSKTCPQCRKEVTSKTIRRAFFTFGTCTTDDSETNVAKLGSTIDSLKLKLILLEQDVKNHGDQNTTLKKQNKGLRAEVKQLEAKIEEQKSIIFSFKQQLKYMSELDSSLATAKKDVVRLRKSLEEFQHIQMLLTGSQDEVEELLSHATSTKELATYVSVMKREIETNVQRRREVRERVKQLEKELEKHADERKKYIQLNAVYKKLQRHLIQCENDKISLQDKLDSLTCQIGATKDSETNVPKHDISETPTPQKYQSCQSPQVVVLSSDTDTTPCELNEVNNEKESSRSIQPNKPRSSSTSTEDGTKVKQALSIFSKKSRITALPEPKSESQGMYYDGFGGHSKIDVFPSPLPRFKTKVLKKNLISIKPKRRKLNSDNVLQIDLT